MNPATLTVREVWLTADPAARSVRLQRLADSWLRAVARQGRE